MKEKILIILENFHGWGNKEKLRFPTYGINIINRKNATYSRIVPYLEDEFIIRFTETTPWIAKNSKQKFPIDYDWVKRAVESDSWFAIITACSKAKKAMDDLNMFYDYSIPHPTSFKWRKTIIVDCKQYLLTKRATGRPLNVPVVTNSVI